MTDLDRDLVGRDATVRAVLDALGDRRSVCVTGPPGVGRSAVLRAVADTVGADPIVPCFMLLGDQHLVPLTTVFGPLEGDTAAVADAVAALRPTTADGGPAPVAVDDLQWADGRTLDVVVALTERVPVVATALAGSTAVERLADAGALVVDVAPLDQHLARELLATLPEPLDAATATTVVDQAAGLPLLLVHLAAASATPRRAPAPATAAERSAHDAALGILDDLDDDERRALAALGVAGRPLPVALAGPGLSGLLRRGLAARVEGFGALWLTADADGPCARATSPLLGQLAADTLSDDERAAVHEALADASDLPARARHLGAAGATDAAVDTARAALDAATTAAERARAARAAAFVARPEDRAAAVLVAARALDAAQDPSGVEALLAREADVLAQAGPTVQAEAAAIAAWALLGSTRDAAAADVAERALAAAGPDTADGARAQLAAVAATAHASRLDGMAAVQRASEALALAEPGTMPHRRARFVLGAATTLIGLDAGLDAMAEVHAEALADGAVGEALLIGVTLGFSLFPYHRAAEARAVLDDTIERAVAERRRGAEVHARTVRGSALVWLEQAADHVLDELAAMVEDPASRPHRVGATAMLAQGLGDRGRHGEAMARLSGLAEVAAGVEMERVTADSVACELAVLVGEHDAVAHHAERVQTSAAPVRMAFHTSRLALAWRAVELGETVEAIDGDSAVPAMAALGRAYRGTVALAEGRLEEAHTELLAAVDPCDGLVRRDALRSLVGAALAADGMGWRDEAVRCADAALARCAQHRLDGLATWATRLLAPADLPAAAPVLADVLGPAPAPLTERQAEVLGRFVDGQSPSAIAAALGVSERTVHQHLRAARQRFDAATTAEAAVRWLEATGPGPVASTR